MFSVIIPLYNKENSITETIKTVLEQTYTEFEVLIVDDGSTDSSKYKVQQFQNSKIRLIEKENGGVSSARNRGIKEAKYKFLAFLDADDIWEPNYLEEQAKLITEFPDAKMWGCAFGYLKNGQNIAIDHKLPVGYRGYIDDYFGMKKGSVIFWTSSLVVHQSVFDHLESFDERMSMGEDLDMWYRIILNYPVAFYNKILTYYRLDAENKAMNKQIVLKSFLPFYIDKYDTYRNTNASFRYFFDKFCLNALYPLYKKNKKDKDIQRILRKINLNDYSFSYRLRFACPFLFDLILKFKTIA